MNTQLRQIENMTSHFASRPTFTKCRCILALGHPHHILSWCSLQLTLAPLRINETQHSQLMSFRSGEQHFMLGAAVGMMRSVPFPFGFCPQLAIDSLQANKNGWVDSNRPTTHARSSGKLTSDSDCSRHFR